jgi:hypothetical protein
MARARVRCNCRGKTFGV